MHNKREKIGPNYEVEHCFFNNRQCYDMQYSFIVGYEIVVGIKTVGVCHCQ